MNALAYVRRTRSRAAVSPAVRTAIEDMTYELVPFKSVTDQIQHLPANARVSVTASPVKSLEDTLDLCAELIDRGHRPVPHLAARMVDDEAHVRSLATRITHLGITEIFCIAGDADDPGAFADSSSFLRSFLQVVGDEIDIVGVAAYPDGHAFIEDAALAAALVEKQELLAEAGVEAHMSTQMCFSPDTIRRWLTIQRAEGITMSVQLGVPGVVDRARLMSMGMRLGVGASLRFLKRNRSGIIRLFASTGYNPTTLIDPLSRDFEPLGIEGLHVFTFNQIEATRQWQAAVLS